MRTVLAALLALAPFFAFGQKDFPNRPIRVLVPFTAGSGADTSSRFFGDKISTTLGQPVVVENRPGADAVIAVMAAKTAPADGYTLLMASISPIAVNPVAIKDLPYDPLKDFKPLSGLTRGMNVLVVAPGSSIKSLAELVAASKKAPAPLNVGSYSMGYRLVIEWFAGMAGIKISYVPYKGAAPVFNDVMGRALDYGLVDMGGAVSLIKAGKMRALAVTGEKRHPEAPDVPTIAESGYPDLVTYAWTSFYVRSETPDDATAKISGALQKALATNEARDFIKVTGGELMPYPPEAMRKFQRDELDRFRRIAEAAGIKPQ